jgi:hypothetical protein
MQRMEKVPSVRSETIARAGSGVRRRIDGHDSDYRRTVDGRRGRRAVDGPSERSERG